MGVVEGVAGGNLGEGEGLFRESDVKKWEWDSSGGRLSLPRGVGGVVWWRRFARISSAAENTKVFHCPLSFFFLVSSSGLATRFPSPPPPHSPSL